jgi:hypothetical protein
MDNLDPRVLWYVAGFIGMLSTLGFIWLHFKAGKKFEAMSNGSSKNSNAESHENVPDVDPEKVLIMTE